MSARRRGGAKYCFGGPKLPTSNELGINFPIAQDICYIGLSGSIHKVDTVNAPITRINWLGIRLPSTRTSVTQRICFQIICAIISGLIGHFANLQRCHSTKMFLDLLSKMKSFAVSSCKSTGIDLCFNSEMLHFFGVLFLPSEVRPCQAICSQTNLKDPKHQKRTQSQQRDPFGNIGPQNIST